MNNEKIIAWAVMKDGECLSVRRFEPVASGEAEGVEFVPLVRFAEQPAQRTWVALTDEDVSGLFDFAYADDEEFIRNVEAKLKEKNT